MNITTIRNLVYALIAICIGAVVYLTYTSIKHMRKSTDDIADLNKPGVSGNPDSTYKIRDEGNPVPMAHDATTDTSTSSEGATIINSGDVPSGHLVEEGPKNQPKKPVKASPAPSTSGDVMDVTVETPASAKASAKVKPSASTKPTTAKVAAAPAKKTTTKATAATKEKPVAKAKTAKSKSSGFMVMAGSFSTKDNATVMLDKVKKLGFGTAEIIRFENSVYTSVCAARYSDRASADSAAKRLKAENIQAFVRTKNPKESEFKLKK